MSFFKVNFTKKNIIELKLELECYNHVVEYKYIKGKDFKENMLFLVESLTKPIILVIEEKDYNNININNILQGIVNYALILYVIENEKIQNEYKYNYIDKFYLDYY